MLYMGIECTHGWNVEYRIFSEAQAILLFHAEFLEEVQYTFLHLNNYRFC